MKAIPNPGFDVPPPWDWREEVVDQTRGYFQLRYGDASDGDEGWASWLPVALVGWVEVGTVAVEWLVAGKDPATAEILRQARGELDFYLKDKHEETPWEYLRYHCTTTSNVYSLIHWSYFPKGEP